MISLQKREIHEKVDQAIQTCLGIFKEYGSMMANNQNPGDKPVEIGPTLTIGVGDIRFVIIGNKSNKSNQFKRSQYHFFLMGDAVDEAHDAQVMYNCI